MWGKPTKKGYSKVFLMQIHLRAASISGNKVILRFLHKGDLCPAFRQIGKEQKAHPVLIITLMPKWNVQG